MTAVYTSLKSKIYFRTIYAIIIVVPAENSLEFFWEILLREQYLAEYMYVNSGSF